MFLLKHYYPAIFETAKEGGYTVTVPDIEGFFTEGKNLENAMWMAQDVIGCCLDDVEEKNYPRASGVNEVDTTGYKDFFVTLVEFDKSIYDQHCQALAIAREQMEAMA